jgi:hypothetical protein
LVIAFRKVMMRAQYQGILAAGNFMSACLVSGSTTAYSLERFYVEPLCLDAKPERLHI